MNVGVASNPRPISCSAENFTAPDQKPIKFASWADILQTTCELFTIIIRTKISCHTTDNNSIGQLFLS